MHLHTLAKNSTTDFFHGVDLEHFVTYVIKEGRVGKRWEGGTFLSIPKPRNRSNLAHLPKVQRNNPPPLPLKFTTCRIHFARHFDLMKIYQPLNDWKYFQKKDRILVVPSACQHFSTESSDTNRLQVNMNCITPIHLIFSRSTFIGIVSNHEQQPVAGQVLQTYLVTGPMSRFC